MPLPTGMLFSLALSLALPAPTPTPMPIPALQSIERLLAEAQGEVQTAAMEVVELKQPGPKLCAAFGLSYERQLEH